MNEQYLRSYQVLGITPPYRWMDVRNAYRSLSKQWHPDRFASEHERAVANERMKEINNAYSEISSYYKTHGTIPEFNDAPFAAAADDHIETAMPETAEPWVTDVTHPRPTRRHIRSLLIVGIALLIGFVYVETQQPATDNLSLYRAQDTSATTSPTPTAPPAPTAEDSFGIDSSAQDVLTIQGTPTRVENNVWHYGESRVMFVNDAVKSWIEHPHHPLKLRAQTALTGTTLESPTTFTKGSTMAEVLAVQGSPLRTHGNMWEYGASRVNFEDGRVASWYESPFAPLKIRR